MRSRVAAGRFIRLLVSSKTYRPNGAVETTRDLAVWTLAHRGYSGSGRLDVWIYPTKDFALRAGAELVMRSGLDEDSAGRAALAAGRYQRVLERYEELSPKWHLLRVQAAFLQDDAESDVPALRVASDTADGGPSAMELATADPGAVGTVRDSHLATLSTSGGGPVGLADPMRRAVVAALEAAGWPVEVEHHPQSGALRSYAGPAMIDVARDGDQPEILIDDEHPDDVSVFDLSAPLRVAVWAPMFANVAPELGRVAGIDAYEIATDRTAEQIVAEIDEAVSAARERDLTDTPADKECALCGDRYSGRGIVHAHRR